MALGKVVELPVALPWLKTNYGIVRLANRTPAPASTAFMTLLWDVESSIV